MFWKLLAAVLAAVGLLCTLWMLFGWFFSGGRGGFVVCVCRPDGRELPFVRRMKLLRELELIRCPLVLIDRGICQETRHLAERCGLFIICSPEEFQTGLELEREKIG